MKGPTSPRIKRVSWKHDEMIDFILSESGAFRKVTQNEIARHFGVSPMWVSCIINSDSFQARLAERKGDIIDPLLKGELETAIKGLVSRSVEIIREKLEKKPSFENAMEVFKAAGRNLGLGPEGSRPRPRGREQPHLHSERDGRRGLRAQRERHH